MTEKSADCGNFATGLVTGFGVVRLTPDSGVETGLRQSLREILYAAG